MGRITDSQYEAMDDVCHVVVHHSATDSNASIDDIQKFHQEELGWNGIGYHWVITSRGEILRGRPEQYAGAHCKGLNKNSIGICCIGNFDHHEPSAAVLEALVFCATDVCNRYRLTSSAIIGHGDAQSINPAATVTQCPGSKLQSQLSGIRAQVSQGLSTLVINRSATVGTQEYREAFRSRICIAESVFEETGAISIQGAVENIGKSPWDNSRFAQHETFRIGYRISVPLTGKKVSEGRVVFRQVSVAPGEKVDFSITETLPQQFASSQLLVEIDILKETQFWFADLGHEPYRMFMAPAGIFGRPVFGVQIELISARNMNDYVLLSGELLNAGRSDLPEDTYLEAMCISEKNAPVQIKEDVWPLLPNKSRPFKVVIPRMLMTEHLSVVLQIRLSNKEAITIHPISLHLCSFHSQQTDLPHESAVVSVEGVKQIVRGIYKVSGTAKNTGIFPWKGVQESQLTPVRIGAVLYGPSGPIWEGRYELVRPQIIPGETISFSFLVRAFTEEPHEVTLRVDVVKEQCYWFSSKIQSYIEVPIQTAPNSESIKVSATRNFQSVVAPPEARLLVIAPRLPLYDRETGGKRLLAMLKRYRKEGISVTYLFEGAENGYEIEKYSAALRSLGIECFQNPSDFLSSWEGPPFTTAILGWYSVANAYTELVRVLFPLCRIIVDSVDLHWLREDRGVAIGALKYTQEILLQRKELEKQAYRSADEIWVVTEDDREALVSEIGNQRIKIVSNLTEPFDEFPIGGQGDGIIFVGGFTHPPNISSALFAHQVITEWRKNSGSKVPFYIVGNAPPREVEALHDGELTIVTGFVSELRPWYEKSRIMIAPLRYGAGIKGKICDSIAYGVPVITGAIGNEGIQLRDGDEILLAESEEEYCQALDRAYAPEFVPHEMAKRAMRRVLLRTGLERCWPVMRSSCVAPHVVIGIVTYNARNLLEQCLQSLLANTLYRNFSVAVILNGCEDGSYESARKIAASSNVPIDIITRDTNDFFVRPNNYIIGRYDQSDIVMVNNDIVFTDPQWLSELVDAAYSAPDVGAAGGMLLDQNGKVLEAGARISANGYGEQFGKGLSPYDSAVQSTRYVGFVSGALLYMRRDALNECGYLDSQFHPMYYEDVDWQYRLHREGLKTIYSPRVQAIHAEGSSAGIDTGKGMKRYQEVHRKTFLDKFATDDIEKLSTLT